MARIFAYIAHKDGAADDTAAELLAAAKLIDANSSPTALVTGSAPQLDAVCNALQDSYAEVWKVSQAELAYPNAELVRQALVAILPPGCIVLLPHSHFGVDLGPGLSVKLKAASVSDVVAIEGVEGNRLKVVRQEFGGQISTHVRCDISSGAVIQIRPGAFKPSAMAPVGGTVVDKSSAVGALKSGRRYLETVVAESGDVDISKEAGSDFNRPRHPGTGQRRIAQELADAMGAAVSCSRPVVDAKWLPKSRQVGSSGQTVKPKVYLACGISGSFQHLAGIKGNPFMVAINKNPKAPIFQVADVGIVDDILEFLPELTNKNP